MVGQNNYLLIIFTALDLSCYFRLKLEKLGSNQAEQ
jgi:hypothetical protein